MEGTELTLWEEPASLAEIKSVYAPTLSDSEWKTFLGIGKATGLNPFLREIYAVKYGTNAASIFIGRDGYRKSAQAHREYDYHQSDTVYSKDEFSIENGEVHHKYTLGDRGNIAGAYGVCKRKGSTRANFTFVEYKEYNTGKSLWANKPSTMIKKVAEAQVLRMTFQELFAGTYEESEKWEDKSEKPEVEGLIQEAPKAKVNTAPKTKEVTVTSSDGEVITEEKIKNKTRVDIIAKFTELAKYHKWDKTTQSDKMAAYLTRECLDSSGKPIANLLFISENQGQKMLQYIGGKLAELEPVVEEVDEIVEAITEPVEIYETITEDEAAAVFGDDLAMPVSYEGEVKMGAPKYKNLEQVMMVEMEARRQCAAGEISEGRRDEIINECRPYRLSFTSNQTSIGQ